MQRNEESRMRKMLQSGMRKVSDQSENTQITVLVLAL